MNDEAPKKHLTLEMRLDDLVKNAPLVTGDEKIAVFGANGQIGKKLKPLLEKYYGAQNLRFYDVQENKNQHIEAFNITTRIPEGEEGAGELAVGKLIKQENIKVVINLAALLSIAAAENPALAKEINEVVPAEMIKNAQNWGVRKLMIPSSIAAMEFNNDTPDDIKAQRGSATNKNKAPATIGGYGQQKVALENTANEQMASDGNTVDFIIPRLAGVLACNTPKPAKGTTETIDNMVVECARHYLNVQEAKARGHEATVGELKKESYIPELPADTTFSMIDGDTLGKAMLLLLHRDRERDKNANCIAYGPVQNLHEFSANLGEVAKTLKQLNPDFKVEFLPHPATGKTLPPDVATHGRNAVLHPEKLKNAGRWPTGLNTLSVDALMDTSTAEVSKSFRQYDNAADSVTDNFWRVVEELKQHRMKNMSLGISEANLELRIN